MRRMQGAAFRRRRAVALLEIMSARRPCKGATVSDVVLAAWLGGAACYVGVLLTGSRPRLPLLGIASCAVVWPVCIAVAALFESEDDS